MPVIDINVHRESPDSSESSDFSWHAVVLVGTSQSARQKGHADFFGIHCWLAICSAGQVDVHGAAPLSGKYNRGDTGP